jgi:pimeloyl-ACP methyl ester carboxylesterase
MGGSAAADAAVAAPGEIDRLVLLGSQAGKTPSRLAVPALFIVAANDTTASGTPRLVRIREQYAVAPGPKALVVLDGSAHAQALFATGQGPRVMREILAFLQP